VHTTNFGNVFAGTGGHESNLIKMVVSGSTGTPDNGNNRFDNILITGIPEPASVLLLGLGAVALLRRR
jgi:hypothetical protein